MHITLHYERVLIMPAFKNRSMINEERMDEDEKTLRKLGVGSFYEAYPPVGHLYSVLVQELKISTPDIQAFIDKFNEYILVGDDRFAEIEDAGEILYSRTADKFCHYLRGEWKNIPKPIYDKLASEAYGGKIIS